MYIFLSEQYEPIDVQGNSNGGENNGYFTKSVLPGIVLL